MRQKVSTLVEDSLYRRVRLEAVRQDRQIADIVGDALRRYLDERGAPQGAGVVAASWGSIPADPELLRVVLEDEDGLLDG